jgi:hypothetical protein
MTPPHPDERPMRETDTRGAVLSEDGLYRYRLWRIWNEAASPLVFVMLNPSTANGQVDDPTIRKCVGFAQRLSAGGIVVVNLFAWRATDPKELLGAADPVGAENDGHIRSVLSNGGIPIAAWGVPHRTHCQRAAVVLKMLAEADGAREVRALRWTKDAHPAHPLYLPYTATPKTRNQG